MPTPLLTIAIPTFNRAPFLARSLARLEREMAQVAQGRIELIVSDNASTDETVRVIEQALARGLPLHVIRNARNRGADINTAQCFAVATGRYVLVLGDDDLIVTGGLPRLINLLAQDDYGVVCLRPFGFDVDDSAERPCVTPSEEIFTAPGPFLIRCGPLVTFISACVVNKSWLKDIDPFRQCGGQLVQMHLVLEAALRADRNLFVPDYLIAGQRNNSGGYDFAKVFVTEFGRILDIYGERGLNAQTRAAIERQMILTFYPGALLRQRRTADADLVGMRKAFAARYTHEPLYRAMIVPILSWPRPMAWVWGHAAMVAGRLLNGEWPRGLAFLKSKLLRVQNLIRARS